MAIIKPNNNTISAITALPAAITTGKVLQVVQASKTNIFSSTSTSFVDITDYNVSITPVSSSNKVLIQGFLTVSGNVWNTAGIWFQLVRESTNILTSSGSSINGTFAYAHEAGSENASTKGIVPCHFSFLDSPNTTSATTYKVQGKTTSGTNGQFVINYSSQQGGNYTATSNIIAMEVSA
jgi:hypothetical protein